MLLYLYADDKQHAFVKYIYIYIDVRRHTPMFHVKIRQNIFHRAVSDRADVLVF